MSRNLGFGLVTIVAAGVLLSVVAGGCNGKTSTSSDGPQTSSLTVGAAGGTVTSDDGLASVVIPAGALSADVTITITPVDGVAISGATVVGGAYRFGPSGTQFTASPTISVPYQSAQLPAGDHASDVHIMSSDDGTTFTATPGPSVADSSRVKTMSAHLGTFVAVAPGATDGGAPDTSHCLVTCEGPNNVDGGIGCNCGVTCNGIAYQVQCVCGACTCYQDGVAGKTTTLSISACDNGGTALTQVYANLCGYPAQPNAGGAGGPTSNDGGGSCP